MLSGIVSPVLSAYGVVSAVVGRVFLFLADVALITGMTAYFFSKSRNRGIAVGLMSVLVIGGLSIWVDGWAVSEKAKQDASTTPPQAEISKPPVPPPWALEKPRKELAPAIQIRNVRVGDNAVIAPGAVQRSEGNLSPNIIGNNNHVGTIEVTSPDPYVGTPNITVASWAVTEADRLEELGKQCLTAYYEAQNRVIKKIPNGPFESTPAGVLVEFWQVYRSADELAIAKLQQSLDSRLGPVASASLDQEYTNLQREQADQEDVRVRRGPWLCREAPEYAGQLRAAAARLDRTR
jgi:hypothetical protein